MPTKNRSRPSIEYIRSRLFYDGDTGLFRWRRSDKMPHPWNQKHVGKPAFRTRHSNGYLIGTIDNKKLYAHDVAWAMHHGFWHNDDIDHRNGVRTDNRISNLRAATRSENMRNQSLRSDNTSGAVGVSWMPSASKWVSQINIDGQHIHLGLHQTLEAAIAARKAADAQYGFSQRHGANSCSAGALHIYNPEQLEPDYAG